MNTPLKLATALALPFLLGGAARSQMVPAAAVPPAATNAYNQGTTADGKTIVAPGTYGPFQGPTCEAGSPSCTAAGAELAAVEPGLVSNDEQTKAVKASEDEMLKNGTYKAMTRTPDGKSAVITLPDGSITISDYEKGFNTMPRKPEDILKDPNTPPAIVAAVKKGQMDALAKDASAKTPPPSEPKSFSINSFGSPKPTEASNSFGGDTGATPSADAPPAPDATPDGAAPSDGNADLPGMGRQMAANGLGQNGSVGSDGSAATGPGGSAASRAAQKREMADMTSKAASTAGDGKEASSIYTYTRLANCASGQDCPTLNTLRKTKAQTSNGVNAPGAADLPNEDVNRGTGFFGR